MKTSHFRAYPTAADLHLRAPEPLWVRVTSRIIEGILVAVTLIMLALVIMPSTAHAQSTQQDEVARSLAALQSRGMEEAPPAPKKESFFWRTLTGQDAKEAQEAKRKEDDERNAILARASESYAAYQNDRALRQRDADERAWKIHRAEQERRDPSLYRTGDRMGICQEQILVNGVVASRAYECNMDALIRVQQAKGNKARGLPL